jgi:hypothetical protein
MNPDEKTSLLHARTEHLFPVPFKGDHELLELIWEKLDWALEHCRLDIRDEPVPFGSVRVVTALGIIRYYVDAQDCLIWGMAMKADGQFHMLGPCLHASQLFHVSRCPHWWLRFAFQRWAPMCSGIDLIDDPANRPSNVELATSQRLMRRLGGDPRFCLFADEFDAALGIPEFIWSLIRERAEDYDCNVVTASDIWHRTECVSSVISKLARQKV